ncbi:MAG: helix-turn-helix domain-containing protein [Suipraeoptans sp.]
MCANALNVSRQAISKWELNSSVPDTENIVRICKLFEVSADYLLTDSYEKDDDIPVVQRTYNQMKKYCSKKILSLSIVFVGILCLVITFLLTPHFQILDMKKNGNFYTNELNYIFEVPLVFLAIFSIVCIVLGVFFLIRQNRK